MAVLIWTLHGEIHDIIDLELAGNERTAQQILDDWDASGARGFALLNVQLDFLFLAIYSTTIGLVCVMAANVFQTRIYRNKFKTVQKPMSEWIAVPVPDSGVPREVVDRARAAISDNRPTSSSKWRFWELSGGHMRCGGCGRRMTSTSITPGSGRPKRYFYYRCTKPIEGPMACPGPKTVSAEKVETKVWQVVSSILKDPKTLRADLDAMVESERASTNSHPESEAKAWAERLAEADHKRSRYQDMAAEGLITFEKLGEKLLVLEDARKTAERELEALKSKRDRTTEMEQDRDALLDSLMEIGSEALDTLTPDEKHQLYRILRLEVVVREDRTPEISGAFGKGLGVCLSKSQRRTALK